MTWIKVEEELPIQGWRVRAKNGKRVFDASYYRKKWYWCDKKLHKVTEWEKCPVTYPKISQKDMRAYLRRAEKYRGQMQPKKFITKPPIGLYSADRFNPEPAECLAEELRNPPD